MTALTVDYETWCLDKINKHQCCLMAGNLQQSVLLNVQIISLLALMVVQGMLWIMAMLAGALVCSNAQIHPIRECQTVCGDSAMYCMCLRAATVSYVGFWLCVIQAVSARVQQGRPS